MGMVKLNRFSSVLSFCAQGDSVASGLVRYSTPTAVAQVKHVITRLDRVISNSSATRVGDHRIKCGDDEGGVEQSKQHSPVAARGCNYAH